ncbi:hypothetical protein [Microbacterium sp. PMB16]|uniref:hypothetical protein n=1 Tax=Microbacterium sp. PMB16 TaxID=3120157 RepID=UPI003F4BBF9C
MYSVIGGIDHGEFARSILALDYDVAPRDFVTFACWTPHRYTLSIEQNTVPRELADTIRGQLIAQMQLIEGDSLAERFFDHDYIHVVRGPHEGRVLESPRSGEDLRAGDVELVRLAARLPMMQAMADPSAVSADLFGRLEDIAGEGRGRREVVSLLRHCAKTVVWREDDHSPDEALRMWFTGVAQSYRIAPRNTRQMRLRDAVRMARAVTTRGWFWASGDWGPGLTTTVGLAVASLTRGREQ